MDSIFLMVNCLFSAVNFYLLLFTLQKYAQAATTQAEVKRLAQHAILRNRRT